MTIREKIQDLLDAANATTEAGDDNLKAAVASLIAGYGGGLPEGINMGEFTVAADTEEVAPIAYGLDKFPNYLFIYAKDKSIDTDNHSYIRTAFRTDIGVSWSEDDGYYISEYFDNVLIRDYSGGKVQNHATFGEWAMETTDNDIYIDAPVGTTGWVYKGGTTYGWIAIRVEA